MIDKIKYGAEADANEKQDLEKAIHFCKTITPWLKQA